MASANWAKERPIGHLYGLNNILIVFLAPLAGALTQRIPAYRMVILGSFIAAASVFILALPPQLFRAMADGWVGHYIAHSWLGVSGTVNPYYVMICLFVVIL